MIICEQIFEYLVLDAMDNLQEDLQKHFERCHEFIDSGRAKGSSSAPFFNVNRITNLMDLP